MCLLRSEHRELVDEAAEQLIGGGGGIVNVILEVTTHVGEEEVEIAILHRVVLHAGEVAEGGALLRAVKPLVSATGRGCLLYTSPSPRDS